MWILYESYTIIPDQNRSILEPDPGGLKEMGQIVRPTYIPIFNMESTRAHIAGKIAKLDHSINGTWILGLSNVA